MLRAPDSAWPPEISNNSHSLPCVTVVGKIACIGLINSDHAAESGAVIGRTVNCAIEPDPMDQIAGHWVTGHMLDRACQLECSAQWTEAQSRRALVMHGHWLVAREQLPMAAVTFTTIGCRRQALSGRVLEDDDPLGHPLSQILAAIHGLSARLSRVHEHSADGRTGSKADGSDYRQPERKYHHRPWFPLG